MVGLVLAGVTLGLLFLSPSLSQAEEWETLVDDTRLIFDNDDSYNPSLGVDGAGNIHIVWHDDRDGNGEIYYTKLDNSGDTLVEDTRLTSASGSSGYPSLGVDSSGNVHIAWYYNGYYGGIYYTKLDNDGNTVVNDTRLTSVSNYGLEPSLGLDSSGNIHIAWVDWLAGNHEIYYTKLDNDGNTVVDDTRLTSDNANSWYPSLGVDSFGNIHIAWVDERDGNHEIYYTKGRTTGAVCTDGDGDGYYAEEGCGTEVDCDDTNCSIHPGVTESCDGVDNNCDGNIDEGCYIPGDVNQDGSITPADALCVFQKYLGLSSCLD